MDKDEILRLKQLTGLAALFKDIDYSKSWIPAEEEVVALDEDVANLAKEKVNG